MRRVVGEEMPDRKAVDIVTTPTDDVRSYHINSECPSSEILGQEAA